jgi:prepilin-type N-terminal cleavage/methylation domain-containing protein
MILNKHRQNGFTTIELLVVIAVIAVLAAGVIAAASRMRNQAQNQQARTILNEVGPVQEQYKSEHQGDYASDVSDDSRFQRIESDLQSRVDDSITVEMETGSSDQDYAASIERPNGDGAFCIDDDGDTRGYSGSTSPSSVISGGNCQGTNNNS